MSGNHLWIAFFLEQDWRVPSVMTESGKMAINLGHHRNNRHAMRQLVAASPSRQAFPRKCSIRCLERTLDHYAAVHYRIELEKDAETGGYMASIPQLKGCMTCGEDIAKALANLQDAKRAWLDTAMKRGISIPEADDDPK